jgi:3-deoxy-D-manno-octulosonic-acid transferase
LKRRKRSQNFLEPVVMGVEAVVGEEVEEVDEVVDEAVTVAAEEEAAEVEEYGPKVGTNLFVGSRFEKHG